MYPDLADWPQLLQQPNPGDHFVQVYREEAFLVEAVAEYTGTGLRRGEGVILIVTPAHRAAFASSWTAKDFRSRKVQRRGQLALCSTPKRRWRSSLPAACPTGRASTR